MGNTNIYCKKNVIFPVLIGGFLKNYRAWEDTHKKVFFLVVGPLRGYPPYTNGLVVHATKKKHFFYVSLPLLYIPRIGKKVKEGFKSKKCV